MKSHIATAFRVVRMRESVTRWRWWLWGSEATILVVVLGAVLLSERDPDGSGAVLKQVKLGMTPDEVGRILGSRLYFGGAVDGYSLNRSFDRYDVCVVFDHRYKVVQKFRTVMRGTSWRDELFAAVMRVPRQWDELSDYGNGVLEALGVKKKNVPSVPVAPGPLPSLPPPEPWAPPFDIPPLFRPVEPPEGPSKMPFAPDEPLRPREGRLVRGPVGHLHGTSGDDDRLRGR
jgi:hypothetical protein